MHNYNGAIIYMEGICLNIYAFSFMYMIVNMLELLAIYRYFCKEIFLLYLIFATFNSEMILIFHIISYAVFTDSL